MKLDCIVKVSYKPLGDDRGEDAFAYDCNRDSMHTLAVFDGCGGSGAWKYPEFCNLSGAFVAAQTLAKQHLNWFDGVTTESLQDKDGLADSFRRCTEQTLKELNRGKSMGVSGSLVKSFPSTASCAIISQHVSDLNSLLLTAINVGDSRVYFLTPKNGLIQLTKDDSRGNPDPLASLRDNAPLSNLLNADKPYKVRANQISVKTPCAIVCATDGVFGFVRSPMDFEFMLLDAIMRSASAYDFEHMFEDSVRKITGDDSTCLISFYGFGSFANIKNCFRERYQKMFDLICSINAIEDPKEQESIIQQYWDQYKLHTVYSEMAGIGNG